MNAIRTISLRDRLYTVEPYEGSRIMIRKDDEYLVSGKDFEVVGTILRDEPISSKNSEE